MMHVTLLTVPGRKMRSNLVALLFDMKVFLPIVAPTCGFSLPPPTRTAKLSPVNPIIAELRMRPYHDRHRIIHEGLGRISD